MNKGLRTQYPYYIGSADGKHYVVSDDIDELPAFCTPAPLNFPLGDRQREVMAQQGLEVRELYLKGDKA